MDPELELALTQLQANMALSVQKPDMVVPERVAELNNVATSVAPALEQPAGQVIYMTGMPGTGKTAVLRSYLALLQTPALPDSLSPETRDAVRSARVAKPAAVYVNAMQLLSVQRLFAEVSALVTGERLSPERALERLTGIFGPRSRQRLLLVVDEVDALLSRDCSVLYRLLELTAEAKVVVIAVSNTLNLLEQAVPRVASRGGPLCIDFRPYSADQIRAIIGRRAGGLVVDGLPLVQPDALTMAARVAANASGDARRALALIRDAVDFTRSRLQAGGSVSPAGYVAPCDVQAARQAQLCAPAAAAAKAAPPEAQGVLRMICQLVGASSDGMVEVGALHAALNGDRLFALRPSTSRGRLDANDIVRYLHTLRHLGLVVADTDGAIREWSHVGLADEGARPDIMFALTKNLKTVQPAGAPTQAQLAAAAAKE